MLGDPRLGRREQLVRRGDHLTDEAHLQRLVRAHALALQQQVHQRFDDPEHPHGPHDAAGTGQQPELDLGEAELDPRVVDHDAVVGHEAELQAAAEGRAADRGHHGLAQGLQAAHVGLRPSMPERNASASSGPTLRRSLRSPPAKNVFLAEVMITPATSSLRATSRSTTAWKEAMKSAFIVLAD